MRARHRTHPRQNGRVTSPDEQAGKRGTVWRFGDCELHIPTRELWHQGHREPVRPRVFDLIAHLVGQRPGVVPHADIARAVWGRTDVRPSLVAQAVMQARQAIGDDARAPAMLLSVRGAGYRFAAPVTEGPQATPDEAPAADVAGLHATLADAEAALEARDEERAQFLADQALMMANALGINRERSRALSFAVLVAMRRGTLDQAAGLATQALRLAELEGHVPAAAQARVRLGRIHLQAGNLHGALAHLHAAHGQLDTPELRPDKRRCEWFTALTLRELGQYDAALEWCAHAQATARRLAPDDLTLPERAFEVDTQLVHGDVLVDQGRNAEALACYAQALALNEVLQPVVMAAGRSSSQLCWLGNQALALAGLGRLDDAWQTAEALGQAMVDWREKSGPSYQRWLSTYLGLKAGLLAGSRRFGEAIDAAQQAVDVARAAGLVSDLPGLLSRAVLVHEAAGRTQTALDLLRQKQALMASQQSERAVTLASVLQAENQADTLRRDLDAARQQAQQLALENRALTERLGLLERGQLQDDTGFTSPLYLRSTLAHRQADARQRDVPFCIALLVIDHQPPPDGQTIADHLRPLLPELARQLAGLLPPAQPVVHWQPGLFVFALDGMGARRGAEVCRQLADQLNAVAWPKGHGDAAALAPRFTALCRDAAADDTLMTALDRLHQQVRLGAEGRLAAAGP